MGASEPGQVIELFAKYWNSQDFEGLRSLYEDEAVYVQGPGMPNLEGAGPIVEGLRAFAGGTMTILSSASVVRGDIALTHNRWSLQYPGGSDPMQGETAEVVRRQPDGQWRYAIDNPSGGAVIP